MMTKVRRRRRNRVDGSLAGLKQARAANIISVAARERKLFYQVRANKVGKVSQEAVQVQGLHLWSDKQAASWWRLVIFQRATPSAI